MQLLCLALDIACETVIYQYDYDILARILHAGNYNGKDNLYLLRSNTG